MIVIFCSVSEEMQEVLLYFPQIKDIRPSAQIEDLQILKDIAYKFGYKVRTVAPPNTEDKREIVSLNFLHWNSKVKPINLSISG